MSQSQPQIAQNEMLRFTELEASISTFLIAYTVNALWMRKRDCFAFLKVEIEIVYWI